MVLGHFLFHFILPDPLRNWSVTFFNQLLAFVMKVLAFVIVKLIKWKMIDFMMRFFHYFTSTYTRLATLFLFVIIFYHLVRKLCEIIYINRMMAERSKLEMQWQFQIFIEKYRSHFKAEVERRDKKIKFFRWGRASRI